MPKRGAYIKKVCEICGEAFYVRGYQDKIGNGKYCSIECQGKGHSKFFKDKRLHPNICNSRR